MTAVYVWILLASATAADAGHTIGFPITAFSSSNLCEDARVDPTWHTAEQLLTGGHLANPADKNSATGGFAYVNCVRFAVRDQIK